MSCSWVQNPFWAWPTHCVHITWYTYNVVDLHDFLIQRLFLKFQLAPHKQLTGGVKFVDAVPKSASGKILRRLLKEM